MKKKTKLQRRANEHKCKKLRLKLNFAETVELKKGTKYKKKLCVKCYLLNIYPKEKPWIIVNVSIKETITQVRNISMFMLNINIVFEMMEFW